MNLRDDFNDISSSSKVAVTQFLIAASDFAAKTFSFEEAKRGKVRRILLAFEEPSNAMYQKLTNYGLGWVSLLLDVRK